MAGTSNLFTRLYKWATRQDENFLTDSLAVVLEHLLILAPDVGTRRMQPKEKAMIELTREQLQEIAGRGLTATVMARTH